MALREKSVTYLNAYGEFVGPHKIKVLSKSYVHESLVCPEIWCVFKVSISICKKYYKRSKLMSLIGWEFKTA